MITYVLTVSQNFPAYHKRKGEVTKFLSLILGGDKIHTIRGNYELWKKRFDKINEGKAILSIRYWSGKPYRSPQIELIKFDKSDGIGLEELFFWENGTTRNGCPFYPDVQLQTIAKNDGLSLEDFKDWFKPYDLSERLAIIHFTKFRYHE